ncbi:MAG: hypothetical protein ABMA64_43250 [Myxococcota bacterium]
MAAIDDLLPVLQPAEWDPTDGVARRLFDHPDAAWVTYGWDFPTHFRFARASDLAELGLGPDELHARAVANLEARELQLRELCVGLPGGDRVWVLCADDRPFADAGLLDEWLVRRAAFRLNTAVVAAVTPIRGLLVLGDATDREQLAALAQLAAEASTRADRTRIGRGVWMCSDGVVVGLAAGVEASAAAVEARWTPPALALRRVVDDHGVVRGVLAEVPARGAGSLARDAASVAGQLLEAAQGVDGLDGPCWLVLPADAPPDRVAALRAWVATLAREVAARSPSGRVLRVEVLAR